MSAQAYKGRMQKAIDHLKHEFSKMRVGRASVSMVDEVKVEVYGSLMSLKELAAISTSDSRTIAIQPWDKGVFGDIEKGILAANIGLTPMNDGKVIRVTLPPLTEERRKECVKQIKKDGEDTKVAIRGVRRDTIDDAKGEDRSEDELRQIQDEVQKVTDQFTKEVDRLVEAKSKELLEI